ncbi:helix-turn-helix transcriptional regulator [Paenibacillus larvae]|uniref:Transcriptional regulator, y4mF family n=1 Tax=Paenibacillus larvae subsp. larvae TaxID=147375 RepID=A0A6C0QNA5_9BACL|nr:helix-turn-helix transcriptional regulator [Paenibacillus larvae]QHZ49911.1 transcriptional regulator, y4mF family [Paenibacillus larvae subsp. larvae]
MNKQFDLTIRAARVEKGFTQQALAEKLGVSKRTIVNWEKGNVEIKPHVVYSLAYVFDMHADHIRVPAYGGNRHTKSSKCKQRAAEELSRIWDLHGELDIRLYKLCDEGMLLHEVASAEYSRASNLGLERYYNRIVLRKSGYKTTNADEMWEMAWEARKKYEEALELVDVLSNIELY